MSAPPASPLLHSVAALAGVALLLSVSPLSARDVGADAVIRIVEGIHGLVTADMDSDGDTDFYDLFLLSLNWQGLLTQLTESSPLNNESGVAITRETVLRFNSPLDQASVSGNSIHAEFGGQPLAANLHISPDRKTVTLFYAEELPPLAHIRVTVDGNELQNERGITVDADRDGVPGGIAQIEFDTLTLTTLPGTAVCGRVFASELANVKGATQSLNFPLKGARITVDGMEDTLFAVTDSLGNFRLEPSPVGRFFVHVDGRTVSEAFIDGATIETHFPEGPYYPFVGKPWQSYASRETNIGNVFLPVVKPGSLRPVSATEETTVPFPDEVLAQHPEFEGVMVRVPADSLYSDDGSRGGMVGIAPVPPDRLPGQMTPGTEPPLVITVQTDGPTNFDVPVPACFPNLPNIHTGQLLAPGEKTALYSFDHDIGEFRLIGPATVNDDGTLICTDPGVGILAPGWHFPPTPPPVTSPGDDCEGCCPIGGKSLGPLKGPGPDLAELGQIRLAHRVATGARLYAEAYASQAKDEKGILARFNLLRNIAKAAGEYWKNVLCPLYMSAANALNQMTSLSCGGPPSPPPPCTNPYSKGDGQPIYDVFDNPQTAEVVDLISQISALLYPYILVDTIPPSGVLSAADALFSQAQVTAGGDAAAYLAAEQLALEERVASALTDPQEEIRGNPPPYPIPFNALFLRSNGETMEIRKKTDPNGIFEVIPPADGELLLIGFYDHSQRSYGYITPNRRLAAAHELPRFFLLTDDIFTGNSTDIDFDDDGLNDHAEFVLGTLAGNPDSDGDGISDGAELDQGTDPLDGLPTLTGIIATADTLGTAVDVATGNDLVLIADSNAGISVFNVFNGMNPVVIAQVDTPGTAQRVAISGNTAVVADGNAGLAVIDLSNPPDSEIVDQISLGGVVQAVASSGNTAYTGLSSGDVVWVDIPSAEEVGRVRLTGAIQDLAVQGDYLYALSSDRLYVLDRFAESMPPLNSAPSPIVSSGNTRLFVGGDLAYATHGKGYNTFSLVDPEFPVQVGQGNTPQFGWKQIVDNGSGLGVAAVGNNLSFDGAHDVSLYDVGSPTLTNQFLTTFETPGIARAVALYNGLAYTADHNNGMQVINYIPYDSQDHPPVIHNLDAPNLVEEGTPYRITVDVTDDVQVRNVEFHVDGNKQATDGNFPFEVFPIAPYLVDQVTLTLQIRASDTGGNFVLSETREITIGTDISPPRVRSVTPRRGALVGQTSVVKARFSEALEPTTVTPDAFRLIEAGPDGVPGNGDDILVNGGTLAYDENIFKASLSFVAPLPPGDYRIEIGAPIEDLAGNPIAATFTSSFFVFSFTDADGDGFPDELEAVLGLNPSLPDTDGDGILDGDEDNDNDGVTNAQEVLVLGTEPADNDSDDDGVLDGNEDPDQDGLANRREFEVSTHPLVADTDDDGWNDETEVTAESDPLNPSSTPFIQVAARPPVSLSLGGQDGVIPTGLVMARPPVSVSLGGNDGEIPTGIVLARPPVTVSLMGQDGNIPSGTVVAHPPVDIEIENQP